eukprot:1160075-Pelagomonas_calceolata.AAC.5
MSTLLTFPFKKWSSHASAACMAASLVAANAPARQVPKGSRLRAATTAKAKEYFERLKCCKSNAVRVYQAAKLQGHSTAISMPGSSNENLLAMRCAISTPSMDSLFRRHSHMGPVSSVTHHLDEGQSQGHLKSHTSVPSSAVDSLHRPLHPRSHRRRPDIGQASLAGNRYGSSNQDYCVVQELYGEEGTQSSMRTWTSCEANWWFLA